MYHEFAVTVDGNIDHSAIQRWIKQKMEELEAVIPGITLGVRWRGSAVDKNVWDGMVSESSTSIKDDIEQR